MPGKIKRREFFKHAAVSGSAICVGGTGGFSVDGSALSDRIISPGCVRSKVRVAKIYLGRHEALWPTPSMELPAEIKRYEEEFSRMKEQFADVDFTVNELVTSAEDLRRLTPKLREADGILAVHLSMGIGPVMDELLGTGKPVMLFAAPYSGHEWTGFGSLMEQPKGGDAELHTERRLQRSCNRGASSQGHSSSPGSENPERDGTETVTGLSR